MGSMVECAFNSLFSDFTYCLRQMTTIPFSIFNRTMYWDFMLCFHFVFQFLLCFPTHWSRCNAAKWIFARFIVIRAAVGYFCSCCFYLVELSHEFVRCLPNKTLYILYKVLCTLCVWSVCYSVGADILVVLFHAHMGRINITIPP